MMLRLPHDGQKRMLNHKKISMPISGKTQYRSHKLPVHLPTWVSRHMLLVHMVHGPVGSNNGSSPHTITIKKWHMGGQPHCRQQECDPNSPWLCDRGDLDIRVTKTTADMEQIIPYAYSIDL